MFLATCICPPHCHKSLFVVSPPPTPTIILILLLLKAFLKVLAHSPLFPSLWVSGPTPALPPEVLGILRCKRKAATWAHGTLG